MSEQLIKDCLKENGYTLGGKLGKGGEGQVYLVTKNNKEFAAKVLLNKTTSYEKLARDLRGCEYVVYPLEILEKEENGSNVGIYIMPVCHPFKPKEQYLPRMIANLLSGIEELSKAGYCQKDDFTGNILLKPSIKNPSMENVAISDFSSFAPGKNEKDQISKMFNWLKSNDCGIEEFENSLAIENGNYTVAKVRAALKAFYKYPTK